MLGGRWGTYRRAVRVGKIEHSQVHARGNKSRGRGSHRSLFDGRTDGSVWKQFVVYDHTISRKILIADEVVLVLLRGFAQRLASAILWCC